MFPWLRLASDADWNIPTKQIEPEKGVDLYGRYMSKSGFLGQSYRPRLIRRNLRYLQSMHNRFDRLGEAWLISLGESSHASRPIFGQINALI